MTELYTTNQVVEITQTSQRTFSRYGSRYLPPTIRGGGRGRPNKYDKACGLWAMALTETLALFPNLDPVKHVSVYLGKENRKSGRAISLTDGDQILDHIRENKNVLSDELGILYGLAAMISCGWQGSINERSKERFADVLICRLDEAADQITDMLNPRRPPYITTDKLVPITAWAVIDLHRFHLQFNIRVLMVTGKEPKE